VAEAEAVKRRKAGLTPEDEALWAHVTREVEPLKRRRRKGPAPAPAAVEPSANLPPQPVAAPVPRSAARSRPKPPPLAPALPPLLPIDRQERRRLVRGTRRIDGRIDLHGMHQARAHEALRAFLVAAQARGLVLVLVITGKGSGDAVAAPGERGVLRRVVPQWLGAPDLRSIVLGFEEAHAGHGGGGALYVRLRRGRRQEAAP
jgi:DNA-nicking Smr family endonuclease